MRRAHLPLRTLAFLALATSFAFAAGDDSPKQGAPQQGRGAIDLEELARQAGATRAAVMTLPSGPTKWPAIDVNGKSVSSDFVQIVNLYLSADASMAAVKVGVALEKEIEKAKQEGRDLSHVLMTDEQYEQKILEFKKNVERLAPDISWEQYLVRAQQTEESFRAAYRTQLMFDSYFLPRDSSKWPPLTLEIAGLLRPGLDEKQKAQFLEDLKQANRSGDQSQPNVIAMFILKQQILKRVVESLDVKDLLDGLPGNAVLSIDGRVLTAEDLAKRGMGLGTYMDFLKAIQFAAIHEAVRQAIVAREDADWDRAKKEAAEKRAKGEDAKDPARPVYWLAGGSEEFRAAFDAEVKRYPTQPPFDHKGIVRFRKFPTMAVYRLYFQMMDSYKRMSAAERNAAALEKHVQDNLLFFNNGQAEVECVWFSAQADPARGQTAGSVEEGFGLARERAVKALADLKEGARRAEEARKKAKEAGKTDAAAEDAAVEAAKGFTFRDILDRDSDYKDPQQKPGQPAPMSLNNRGRFGPLARNPLSERMHESELTNLLTGALFSEDLFFRAKIGEVYGPFRGANGYYLARVVARSPGGKVPDLKDAQQRSLAEDDFANHAFQEFVNSVMAKTKVQMRL